jgi:hypothetical protein
MRILMKWRAQAAEEFGDEIDADEDAHSFGWPTAGIGGGNHIEAPMGTKTYWTIKKNKPKGARFSKQFRWAEQSLLSEVPVNFFHLKIGSLQQGSRTAAKLRSPRGFYCRHAWRPRFPRAAHHPTLLRLRTIQNLQRAIQSVVDFPYLPGGHE